jgi:hypothetical protein
MAWDRATVTASLAQLLSAALAGAVTVFDRPPLSLNVPAVVIGRVEQVQYGTPSLGIDTATLPVHCVGAIDADDTVDALKAAVRLAVFNDWTIAGTVQRATCTEERNWRNVPVGGAEVLAVDLIIQITM